MLILVSLGWEGQRRVLLLTGWPMAIPGKTGLIGSVVGHHAHRAGADLADQRGRGETFPVGVGDDVAGHAEGDMSAPQHGNLGQLQVGSGEDARKQAEEAEPAHLADHDHVEQPIVGPGLGADQLPPP